MAAPLTSSGVKLDTPPWLQEPTVAPAKMGTNQPSLRSVEEGKATETETPPEVPRMILYTRVINLILSICMIVVSLLAMLTTQSATTGVLSCYLIIFACLLCCFETHLKQVSKIIALNFGFMYSARSRSIFMLFVGEFPLHLYMFEPYCTNHLYSNKTRRNNFVFVQPVRHDRGRVHDRERVLQHVHLVQVPGLRGVPAQRCAERHQGLPGHQPRLRHAHGRRQRGHHQEQPRYGMRVCVWCLLLVGRRIVATQGYLLMT